MLLSQQLIIPNGIIKSRVEFITNLEMEKVGCEAKQWLSVAGSSLTLDVHNFQGLDYTSIKRAYLVAHGNQAHALPSMTTTA